MKRFDRNVRARQGPLQQLPEVFEAVGVNLPVGVRPAAGDQVFNAKSGLEKCLTASCNVRRVSMNRTISRSAYSVYRRKPDVLRFSFLVSFVSFVSFVFFVFFVGVRLSSAA